MNATNLQTYIRELVITVLNIGFYAFTVYSVDLTLKERCFVKQQTDVSKLLKTSLCYYVAYQWKLPGSKSYPRTYNIKWLTLILLVYNTLTNSSLYLYKYIVTYMNRYHRKGYTPGSNVLIKGDVVNVTGTFLPTKKI